MPSKPYEYVRVVIGGTILGVQGWSTGIGVSVSTPPNSADLATFLGLFESSVSGWWSTGTPSMANLNSTVTLLTEVRAYYYPANSSAATAQALFTYPTPLAGAQGQIQSTRNSICASTLTGLPGRSNRGRMYVPATGASLQNHQYKSGDVGDVSAITATLLGNLNLIPLAGAAVQAAVVGKTSPTIITDVKVDSLPDTIRRREDKLTAAFAPSTPV